MLCLGRLPKRGPGTGRGFFYQGLVVLTNYCKELNGTCPHDEKIGVCAIIIMKKVIFCSISGLDIKFFCCLSDSNFGHSLGQIMG